MATDILRQHVANVANSYVRNNANAGISWGTNNFPAGSLGWFAGDTNGIAQAFDANWIAGGDASASNVAANLRNFANLFGGIRRTRIVIYYLHYQFGTQVQYDGTAFANTIYGVGDFASGAALPGLGGGADMDLNNLNACGNSLWNSYYANCRNTTLTLTNTICHTSCHDNCHCARGRR